MGLPRTYGGADSLTRDVAPVTILPVRSRLLVVYRAMALDEDGKPFLAVGVPGEAIGSLEDTG